MSLNIILCYIACRRLYAQTEMGLTIIMLGMKTVEHVEGATGQKSKYLTNILGYSLQEREMILLMQCD